jgi:hypothetical protein
MGNFCIAPLLYRTVIVLYRCCIVPPLYCTAIVLYRFCIAPLLYCTVIVSYRYCIVPLLYCTVIVLYRYCIQGAIHPANFHCHLYNIRQWNLRRSQLTPLQNFNNLLRLYFVTLLTLYAYNPQMVSVLFFRQYSKRIWHSEDRASWYRPILIIKTNEMHCFSHLFDKALYVFWTGLLSIIRSISTLYTPNRYLSC